MEREERSERSAARGVAEASSAVNWERSGTVESSAVKLTAVDARGAVTRQNK